MQTRISVRTLVEFIMRSGDIDNRIGGGSDNAMQEGSRLHRMLQKRAGADYHAEVTLYGNYTEGDIELLIEGRADGLIENESGITVDEIKCTYQDVMKYKEPKELHLAQAKFYAHMVCMDQNLPVIKVRMSYVNIDTEEIRYFNFTYLAEELKEFTDSVCHEYIKWARFQAEWLVKRNESISGLPFPFDYRPGQDTLVKQVYFTIKNKKKLFLEAPTGVGKTIATLYPAIQSQGAGLSSKIFYLTAKTITRTVAADTINILRDKGLIAKSIILTAKEKICIPGTTECNPDACPYAKGHFDRINDCIFTMLNECNDYTREVILQYAERFKVCPFELSLDLSTFSDVIIGDYNYAFDPRAKLKRYFEAAGSENYLFLIDEAHNLVDRAREMYSATLVKEDFLTLKKLTEQELPKISRACDKCNKELLNIKKTCDDYVIEPPIAAFTQSVMRLYAAMETFLQAERSVLTKRDIEKKVSKEVKEAVLDFYFDIGHFLETYELVDENYCVHASYDDRDNFFVKLFCVNPRQNLKECMELARSTILFSATLLPIKYHKNLLAGEESDYEVYAESIFDPAKRGLFIARDVTSKYTRRSGSEYEKIACYIKNTVEAKAGNYMVFFPSYSFMDSVYQAFSRLETSDTTELLIQKNNMDEIEKEDFLNRFKGGSQSVSFSDIDFNVEIEEDTTLIGFCVIGGIFSEGIDLKEDSLIGAIIVGTGFPQVCLEREIMKNTFDAEGNDGFDYAYRYPGLNKVLQAAGRVIRTERDEGIVALLDERFLQSSYKNLFPREWRDFKIVSNATVKDEVESFWKEHE